MYRLSRLSHPAHRTNRSFRARRLLPGPVFIIGLLIIWGCLPATPAVDQTDNAAEAGVSEPAAEATQAEPATPATQTDTASETNVPAETVESSDTVSGDRSPQATDPEDGVSTEDTAESGPTVQAAPVETNDQASESAETNETAGSAGAEVAHVMSVQATGDPGAYRFAVQISSPDQGCQQYADWWEVLSEDGELLYRRILAHSHVTEQPFVRSGGPVPIEAESVVWVRAHMNPAGYGGTVLKGSVQAGFEEAELSPQFAAEAAGLSPLPSGCAF